MRGAVLVQADGTPDGGGEPGRLREGSAQCPDGEGLCLQVGLEAGQAQYLGLGQGVLDDGLGQPDPVLVLATPNAVEAVDALVGLLPARGAETGP
ncbi:hypothetical protein ACFW9L_02145 [Streptomyces sp. NPDC059517]|uniref:hypothetical protein n=1 Tax=Streptomyces sp. NPDC059517 TaxID=3346855 RepID=UPI0036A14C01